jgi:hypothetical protein
VHLTNGNFLLFQYPLPEVVVIHQDNQYLQDVKSLESYIIEVSYFSHHNACMLASSCPASLRGERFVAVMLLQTYSLNWKTI